MSFQREGLILFLLVILFYAFYRLFLYKKKVADAPFPVAWRKILLEKVNFYRKLSDVEKKRFEQNILQFLDRVNITGVEVTIDDTDKLLVAASAVVPLFGFSGWQYRNLNEVLLYEGTFNHDFQTREGEERNILGMVGSGYMNRMMILSRPALHRGFETANGKENVGIHEFVHLLDKADGETDGVPEYLMDKQYVLPWLDLMHKEIKALRTHHSDINEYGGTNESEFLSVVSEYFFQQPHLLKKHHPELFSLLEKIFHQHLA